MSTAFEGRVIVNFGRHMIVETPEGTEIDCRIKGRSMRPVCGDRVTVERMADASGLITAVKERRSLLVRHDRRLGQQPLAANIDRMLVVIAPKPSFDVSMIDRYLAAAEILNITPVLVLNKTDLLDETQRVATEQTLGEYAAIGYSTLKTSVFTGNGIAGLAESLNGHTGVVVGQSGTGKSSLLKALAPGAEVRIGEISYATDEGRHTTTVSALYHLPAGGELIDSPGVRGFQLWPMPPKELARGFVEFGRYNGQCRFSDCSHLHEPGCRVREAVERGELIRRRYESYRAISAQSSG
ncbi:MAG TPA: ribosome small subunit-dependent GTPase A [Gammaproteobacteria bacterium]|nr:ribosome small subunit-dependent GTPase A [Gammaproteobacteria bacterium]